jgi:CRP/FNR family transcriptional regulator, cyclic AMP receptor protein
LKLAAGCPKIIEGRRLRNDMLSKDAITSLLSRTDLFGGLALDDLQACAANFREARFVKGEVLFARGEPGTHLYLVVDGRVRLAIATEGGRELSFRHAVSGDLFGEIAALDGGPRSAEATAVTRVIAYALERNIFRDLWSTRPAISARVIVFLCRRLRETSDQLEAVALYPIEVRLARVLLCMLGTRNASSGLGTRNTSSGPRASLELGFSQSELAQLVGASRPKVNAALGMLETAGAVKRTLDRLFCDPVKLAELARRDDA